MKSFAVEGTVFWLIVNTIIVIVTIDPADISLLASALVFAVLYLILAYVCWTQKRWGFIVAIVLAVIAAVGSVAFDLSTGFASSAFEALSNGAFLIVPQLILILFSLRAYRELAPG